ncbi:MAG: hypothetical protein AAGA56_02990, partial [Myxococcota bacterium]
MVPYQEAPSPPMTEPMREACARAIHVVKADGEVLRAGTAAMYLLRHLGFPLTGAIGVAIPFIWSTELGYAFISTYRGRLYRSFL